MPKRLAFEKWDTAITAIWDEDDMIIEKNLMATVRYTVTTGRSLPKTMLALAAATSSFEAVALKPVSNGAQTDRAMLLGGCSQVQPAQTKIQRLQSVVRGWWVYG